MMDAVKSFLEAAPLIMGKILLAGVMFIAACSIVRYIWERWKFQKKEPEHSGQTEEAY